MKIRINGGGIYGVNSKTGKYGELPVGYEMEVDKIPIGWASRVIVLDDKAGKTPITNEEKSEETEKRGPGRPSKQD